MRMERTACFGSCPVFDATLYENGLLIYNGKRFTYSLGCHYAIISKDQVKKLQAWFADANFWGLKDKYPEEDIAPTDLPGCVIFFNNGKQQKTILDRGWKTPKTLTELESKVDTWISIQNLQSCGK